MEVMNPSDLALNPSMNFSHNSSFPRYQKECKITRKVFKNTDVKTESFCNENIKRRKKSIDDHALNIRIH